MPGNEATRKPTRDYRSFSSTPWSIWDTMYSRRSVRKYEPEPLTADMELELDETVAMASSARGAPKGTVFAVSEDRVVELMRKGVYKGIPNKINLWLARSRPAAFLVIALQSEDVKRERPLDLPLAVMAAEDCVLWLTEHGMGTCWLAGVNEGEIKRVTGLSGELSVPCVISVGAPRRSLASYDAVASVTLSRRRKPLEKIASTGRYDVRYRPPEFASEQFAIPNPTIEDALGFIAGGGEGGGGRVMEDLAIEACLESARIAPNGGNLQAWHFVVVREPGSLADLAVACRSGAEMDAAIVAAGQVSRLERALLDRPFWMLDAPIALSHMSLMAASMGLAHQVFVKDIAEQDVNRLAGLPTGLRTAGVIGLRWVSS